jgi:hypothetical protein
MRKRESAAKIRKDQVIKQLDVLRDKFAAKSRKDYKTDYSFEQAQTKQRETISLLEQELSTLNYPGEYYELPVAIVADELGLSIAEVRQLIYSNEIEASGRSPHERVNRDELGRAAELGNEELFRLHEENPKTVFNKAVECIKNGDWIQAEQQYQRLDAREECIGPHALAVEIALLLNKGEYSEIKINMDLIGRRLYTERAEVLANLKRILQVLNFDDENKRARLENLYAVCENQDDFHHDDPERYAADYRKTHYKKMDDMQLHTMYIATVVKNEIEQSKFHHSLIFNDRFKFPLQLEAIIRNAIYTALYAEATYNELASSKLFVDGIKAQIPKWWEPAKVLKKIPRKNLS